MYVQNIFIYYIFIPQTHVYHFYTSFSMEFLKGICFQFNKKLAHMVRLSYDTNHLGRFLEKETKRFVSVRHRIVLEEFTVSKTNDNSYNNKPKDVTNCLLHFLFVMTLVQKTIRS